MREATALFISSRTGKTDSLFSILFVCLLPIFDLLLYFFSILSVGLLLLTARELFKELELVLFALSGFYGVFEEKYLNFQKQN